MFFCALPVLISEGLLSLHSSITRCWRTTMYVFSYKRTDFSLKVYCWVYGRWPSSHLQPHWKFTISPVGVIRIIKLYIVDKYHMVCLNVLIYISQNTSNIENLFKFLLALSFLLLRITYHYLYLFFHWVVFLFIINL